MAFYKYYCFNEYSLRVIKNGELYFNHFSNFNDPFDMNEGIDNSKEYYGKLFNSCDILVTLLSKEELDRTTILARYYPSKKFGVFCCTRSSHNLLMWAHYANEHTGFCIEFVEQFPTALILPNGIMNLGMIKIEYSNNRIVYKDEKPETIKYVKSEEWSYEDEFRLLLESKTDSKFPRPIPIYKKAINRIYLGVRTSIIDFLSVVDSLGKDNDYEKIIVFKVLDTRTYGLMDICLVNEEMNNLIAFAKAFTDDLLIKDMMKFFKWKGIKKHKKVCKSVPVSELVSTYKELSCNRSLDEIVKIAHNEIDNPKVHALISSFVHLLIECRI